MRNRLLSFCMLFSVSFSTVIAGEQLFDLSKADYFDNANFSFIQTINKKSGTQFPRGNQDSPRRSFMPTEGEVRIDFQSIRHGDVYEIITVSKRKDKLLYTTEVVIDRFGITEKYVMYNEEGKARYSYQYEALKEEAIIEYLDAEGKFKKKKVQVDREAYSMMTLPYIIGAVTVDGNARHTLRAVVGDGRSFEFYLQQLTEEMISVRDRIFTCRRIECGFSGIIGLFVPKMVFWVDEKSKIPVKQDMMGGSIIELEKVYD